MYRIMILVVLALSLAACSRVTITHTDNKVVAVGTGSALQSATYVIDRTNTAAVYACSVDKAADNNSSENDDSDPVGIKPHSILTFSKFAENILEILKQVKETAEQGKGLLNLFGEHSYRVTLSCK